MDIDTKIHNTNTYEKKMEVNMARERNEISNEYKWDLDKMYPNKEAIEADIAYIKEGLSKIARYK